MLFQQQKYLKYLVFAHTWSFCFVQCSGLVRKRCPSCASSSGSAESRVGFVIFREERSRVDPPPTGLYLLGARHSSCPLESIYFVPTVCLDELFPQTLEASPLRALDLHCAILFKNLTFTQDLPCWSDNLTCYAGQQSLNSSPETGGDGSSRLCRASMCAQHATNFILPSKPC